MSLLGVIKRTVPQTVRNRIKEYLFECEIKDPESRECFGQFGEDVCIQDFFAARTWKQSGKCGDYSQIEKGFYVDVGAYRPRSLSNTYWFYRQGWCGINVEASAESKSFFDRIRPRDTNIEAAVSDREGERIFYSWGERSVFNTLCPERVAELVRELGKPTQIRVKTTTLKALLDQHLPEGRTISFLSVDVEGHELQVLRSNDWEKYRPELAVVEDHKACIEEISKSPITSFMRDVGYRPQYWIPPTLIYVAEPSEQQASTA